MEKMTKRIIGERLTEILEELWERYKIEKEDVAKILGMNRSDLSKVLNGERALRLEEIFKLKDIGVNLNYLFSRKDDAWKFGKLLEQDICYKQYYVGEKIKELIEKENTNIRRFFKNIRTVRNEFEFRDMLENKKAFSELTIWEICSLVGIKLDELLDEKENKKLEK